MKKNISKIILFIFTLFVYACSSSPEKDSRGYEIQKDIKPEVNVRVEQIKTWANLMPGDNEKFQISGRIFLIPSNDYNFENVNLETVKVFQNKRMIYNIRPVVRIDEKESSSFKKKILFSTIKGLRIAVILNIDKPVDLELIFKDEEEAYSFPVEDVKIEKAY